MQSYPSEPEEGSQQYAIPQGNSSYQQYPSNVKFFNPTSPGGSLGLGGGYPQQSYGTIRNPTQHNIHTSNDVISLQQRLAELQ